jgi:hypothetical protein
MAKQAPKETTQQLRKRLAQLESENDALEKEIKSLKGEKKAKKSASQFWRATLAGVLAVFAFVSFGLFNVAFWVKTTVIETDDFVAATAPIIEDQAVQQLVTERISTRIFERIDLEERLKQELPQNVAVLAGPIAGQVEEFTQKRIAQFVESDRAADAWETVLRSSHAAIIGYIENPSNDSVITIDELYGVAGKNLQESNVGFLFNRDLPDRVGTIQVADVEFVNEARTAIDTLNKLTYVFAALTILCTAGALWAARNRRAMVIGLSLLSIVILVSTVIALNIGATQAANSAQPESASAVQSIAQIVTNGLREQTYGFIALISAVLALAIITSNVQFITSIKRFSKKQLDSVMSKILPQSFEAPRWIVWISENKPAIGWTLTVAFFVGFALRLPPTVNGVVTAVILSSIAAVILAVADSVKRAR